MAGEGFPSMAADLPRRRDDWRQKRTAYLGLGAFLLSNELRVDDAVPTSFS